MFVLILYFGESSDSLNVAFEKSEVDMYLTQFLNKRKRHAYI